jgi:hypothetical protein
MYSDNPEYSSQSVSLSGEKQNRGNVSKSGGRQPNFSHSGEKPQTQGGYPMGHSGEKRGRGRRQYNHPSHEQYEHGYDARPHQQYYNGGRQYQQPQAQQPAPPQAPQHPQAVGSDFPFGMMSFKYASCFSLFIQLLYSLASCSISLLFFL